MNIDPSPQASQTSGSGKWLWAVIVVGIVYLLAGVALPNPSVPGRGQFLWRLAAWVISAIAYAAHITYEHFRLRTSPGKLAFHVSLAVALGAFALALSANIHSLSAARAHRGLMNLALLIWPIMTGVPSFLVAFVAAAVLTRVRRGPEPK